MLKRINLTDNFFIHEKDAEEKDAKEKDANEKREEKSENKEMKKTYFFYHQNSKNILMIINDSINSYVLM